jgi:hypothetical protein
MGAANHLSGSLALPGSSHRDKLDQPQASLVSLLWLGVRAG